MPEDPGLTGAPSRTIRPESPRRTAAPNFPVTPPKARLTTAVEHYLSDLARLRASGGATAERSSYTALVNLLTAVGGSLKPKVFCVPELADQGAGHPDIGLFSAKQVQRGRPRAGQIPERGVVEIKPDHDELQEIAVGEQVARYWDRYRLVLVTNLREFQLVGPDAAKGEKTLEAFHLENTAAEFHHKLEQPRVFAREVGARLVEYLARALSYRTALTEPRDLAWLLASYARDGLSRVEAAEGVAAFEQLRAALEEALGIRFEGKRGKRFFHSTLVQTLFYGVFSAWVLWARSGSREARFEWRKAVWHLRAPVLRALFQQLSDPGRLQPLGLVEVLDWTEAALDRVDRRAFLARFQEGEAVTYFYEPFLAAFDPDLRKQLGVWYTPNEIVGYMVARVDRALKDDLGIADGLAAENVYVLDPCCGTGAYLAEVLRRISSNLEGKGLGALVGARVKEAATKRVFGFEIMPAPFVVAHLQVGLTMEHLDAPLSDDGGERAQIFLTNALTGWEANERKPLLFPELEEERDRAQRVKQETPILVILGNPPYDGFAGVAMYEERELSDAYRTTKHVRRPEGQGLNDPYVRFFRMAERRIVEKTGRGVVCFISNYSWLDRASFTGMRERYLEAFDVVRVDCLNGDKYRTGKTTPDGGPDPSVFSTPEDPVGIQVGTAIATLVRMAKHEPAQSVAFRHLWGRTKLADLEKSAGDVPEHTYGEVHPSLPLGLPFAPTAVSDDWFSWPSLPELFPVAFPGVKTSRDRFLVDIDLERLKSRLAEYFDKRLSNDEIARRHPGVMKATGRFAARGVREALLARGGPSESGFVRFSYRPFDIRWLYWEAETKLLDEKRADYQSQVFPGNSWIEAREKEAREDFCRGTFVTALADNFGNGLSSFFPQYLRGLGADTNGADQSQPNLSGDALQYLQRLGAHLDDLFFHTLATLHDPAYRKANAGALRMEWPRIPLPGWPDDRGESATDDLRSSAARGRELARLLDPDTPVSGVTEGALRAELAALAIPATTDGGNMSGADFAVTAGWGHFGPGDAVMPGTGRTTERSVTAADRATLKSALRTLSENTLDIWLNDRAYWRNVPAAVWNYRLGGYQVLKKWLSYREHSVLKRPLRPEEVQHFTDTARRIAAILLLTSSPGSK